MFDSLIMLLSTDWFAPYWQTIDLEIAADTRHCIQSSCRGLVRQIVSGTEQYYHVSFSDERIQNTKDTIMRLIAVCHVNDATANLFESLVKRQERVGSDTGRAGWIFFALTKRLLTDWSPREDSYLDPFIRATVARVFAKYDVSEINFGQLCLNSTSTWDRYIRDLTPDQPTHLADYLGAQLISPRTFDHVWSDLRKELSENRRKELLAWYQATAKSFMGLDIPVEDVDTATGRVN
jgi:hypothetical protein